MIKPQSSNWARLIFNPYELFLLKKNFNHFYVTGKIPSPDPAKGLLITPNHISWWDGFFIDYPVRLFFHRNFYIIMLEEQLRKYSFFRRLGAFSIEPSRPKGIVESLDFASSLTSKPNNAVVFYPQGKIEPYDKYPEIKDGLKFILKKNPDLKILPAAFRIEFNNDKKPDVYVRFGGHLNGRDVCQNYDLFINAFTENIESLTAAVHTHEPAEDLFLAEKK